jgi:hypothetical protein
VATLVAAQPTAPSSATPQEPISVILEAFKTHRLVGLGEPHRNEQAHQMRVALIRDGRLAGIANDIVVEFGTARYQNVIDRFVRGEDVPYDTLRKVWQDTTGGATVWDVPIYEEFFRAVRAANASLPRERQFRILLGDPPTDWENVRSLDDVLRPTADYNRDRHAAELIRREVLAKNRRALIIYGDGHLWRDLGFPTLGELLEADNPIDVFTIGSSNLTDLTKMQTDVSSWPAPSIATVRGTAIGAQPFPNFFPVGSVLAERWKGVPVERQYDAIAYYGPRETLTNSEIPATMCRDDAYMEMRLGRLRFLPPGVPDLGAMLREYCQRETAK